jgi:translation initiation factor 1A
MPKNKGAGGKNRRRGKGLSTIPTELVFKEDGQEYAQVTKMLGNGYLKVMCFIDDKNIEYRAHIRGSMRKRVWVSVGDIVLVNLRDYQDGVCDVLMKYTASEAKMLRLKQELPDRIDLSENDNVAFDETEDVKIAEQDRNIDLPESDDDSDVDIDDL